MYFTLSKLLPSLIAPYSLLFWILIYLILLIRKNRLRRAKWVIGITLVICYILSLPLLSSWHQSKQSVYWKNYTLPTEPTEVSIVLGGFMVPDPFFGYGVESSFDRLLTGLRMVHQQKSSFLMLSGGVSEYETDRKAESMYMLDFIHEFTTFPDSLLLIESKSTTTYENALFTKHILVQNNLSLKVRLITSMSHMERATRIFENEGFEVLPIPVDLPVSAQWTESFVFTLIPSLHSLNYWSKEYRETLGSIFYELVQWFKS